MFERNNGQTTNAEKLTWGGSKDPDYEQRRDDANCDGFCTGMYYCPVLAEK
jgi:hypothetical protein